MDSVSWRDLVERKEKEWRDILESRIESQENVLKDREGELQTQREQFNELKDHFKYNLRLLEERDRELEKYDVTFGELRIKLNEKNTELSEVKIHLDDLKNVIKREEKTREELQANYQRRLREKQAEVDQYKSSKDQEIHDEREEYEEFRRNLHLQLTNVQTELDIQKRELTTEFENELKKREHETRVQIDELNAKVLEHDLKAKLLEKELDLTRESNDKTSVQVQEAETGQRELEKTVKQKEWELADVSAVKDSQISELESKLSSAEANMRKMQEDFQRKYTEMDKLSREREETLERAKQGYLSREGALQTTVQELQSKLEDAQIKERQLQWTNQDLVKDKDLRIEKLQEEVRDVKERWDRHVAEMSRENVGRDLELTTALDEQRQLKVELEQRKEDLNRYKNELQRASEREESLDKAKTQTELDWQRRCEDLERQQYDKAEDLIKSLITARNEAQALVKERERELQHQILLVKSLHRERDQLRALLRKNDISLDNFAKYSLEEAEDKDEELNYVEDLQRQNTGLKQLIAQMRLQMESLGQEPPQNTAVPGDKDVLLQEDLQRLRRENRDLQEKLRAARKVQFPSSHSAGDSGEVLSQAGGNIHVKHHIQALNDTIGALRTEKVDLAASVKKHQARLAHLEHSLEELSKQPRQKQIQIDQLTYQLSSQKKRSEEEVTSLKGRVADLELQLSEARREADEYHRASLERNQELVALGNQLSALKMEAAETNPSINFGAQELYIQQLQGELSQLRKRAAALDSPDLDTMNNKLVSLGGEGGNKADLRSKLKSAATKIVHLATENQQLIESNNKLRAQLKAAAFAQETEKQSLSTLRQDISTEPRKEVKPAGEGKGSASDRLSQLEKLQYQLTRQELQFASRFTSDVPTGQSGTSNVESTVPEKDVYDDHRSPIPRTGSRREVIDPKMLMSMSSGGGESIHRVWQMLEESVTSGTQSPPPSPRAVITEHVKEKGDEFQLRGQPVSPSARPVRKPNIPIEKLSKDPRKLVKPKPKIRNYNVKDGSS